MEEKVKNDGRDNKGCFLKGHKAIVIKHNTGNKGGRPKTIKGQVKDALKIAEDAMPEIIKSMIARATGEEECPKNVQQAAAEYLIERIYGKVPQAIEATGKDGGAVLIEYVKKTS